MHSYPVDELSLFVGTACKPRKIMFQLTDGCIMDSPSSPPKKKLKKRTNHKNNNNSHIGSRVAWYFGTALYLGTITEHFPKEDYFHCLYDDSDEQDFDREELCFAIDLYRREGRKIDTRKKSKKARAKEKQSSAVQSPSIHSLTSLQSRPQLFDIHGISPKHIAAVEKILCPKNESSSASLVAEFFLFCYERQTIWKKRKQNKETNGIRESSWITKDDKLSTKFFCNIYRELDRGTAYFRSNLIRHRIKQPTRSTNLEEVLWDSFCYRLLNKIETFERFGKIPSREEWPDFQNNVIEVMSKNKEVIFTAAHQIMGKERYIQTMTEFWKDGGAKLKVLSNKISNANDLESCVKIICTIRNVGKFFAWQVVCDLLESGVLPDFTEDDYAMLGPGARNGLNIIFDESSLGYAILLRQIQHDIYSALELNFPAFLGRDITLKNIEHALCEFCKYKKMDTIKGSRVYDPVAGGRGSRSHLDINKSCRVCSIHDDVRDNLMCVLCLGVYCNLCRETGRKSTESVTSWLCPSCKKIGK